MSELKNMSARSGRIIRSDNTVVNEADGILDDGTKKVQLSGNEMELFGKTVLERPAANMVPVGAVYCAVQTQEYWQSDGDNWVVM